MDVTYQVYTFINIINLSIQIYPYKTELDLPRVRINSCLKSCLARLMLFFYRLNGQPFNFRLPPKQNSLPLFTVYWPFNRLFKPFRRTLVLTQRILFEEQLYLVNYDYVYPLIKLEPVFA